MTIEVPSDTRSELIAETGLKLNVRVAEGNNELLDVSEDRGSPFLGKGRYGFYYVGYKVSRDVPVSKDVTMKVRVGGDLGPFLKSHEKAKIIVRKRSDQ